MALFPAIIPSKRNFDPGNFPVKTFRSQSGVETRVLYGSKRTGMKLSLTYRNITDTQAEEFLDHYHEMKGSYTTFALGTEAKEGWEGNIDALEAGEWGSKYRYAGPPRLTQVKPGISHISVNLVGVL